MAKITCMVVSKGLIKWSGRADNYNTPDGAVLKLTYTSKDLEEGYPGNLQAEVTYTLTNDNELKIDYKATTDKKTVINLTNHSYFNLSGNTKTDILNHEVSIAASKFLPVDKGLIPTGELKDVKGTPFDFTTPHTVGERINDKDQQLQIGGGYDHCWVFDDSRQAFSKSYCLRFYQWTFHGGVYHRASRSILLWKFLKWQCYRKI